MLYTSQLHSAHGGDLAMTTGMNPSCQFLDSATVVRSAPGSGKSLLEQGRIEIGHGLTTAMRLLRIDGYFHHHNEIHFARKTHSCTHEDLKERRYDAASKVLKCSGFAKSLS